MYWRKQKFRPPEISADESFVAQKHASRFFSARPLTFAVSLACMPLAHAAELDDKIHFDIPRQSAAVSLTTFAEQADLTLIFSLDKVSDKIANPLQGEYTVEQAIFILLAETGLTAAVGSDSLLSIQTAAELEPVSALVETNLETTHDRSDSENIDGSKEQGFVMVVGIRGSLQRAKDIKRHSPGIVDAIATEDIGKFPDQNLAESLQRISGVAIDRSGGEGQFITVRGFGPQFNTVLVNGRQLATDNLGREFSFDTIASELVSGVKVHKTSTALLQSGGIGSSVSIETHRPLAVNGFKFAGSVKAQYDSNSAETKPQISGLISNSFAGGTLGLLVSFAHQQRSARFDEAQIDAWLLDTEVPASEVTNSAAHLFVPRNYDQRVTFDERTRRNGTLVLQFRPNDDFELTGDLLYSDFDVKGSATSIGHWFTSSNLEDVITDSNGTAIEFSQNVGEATDIHARTFDRPSEFIARGINASWSVSDRLSMSFDLSNSESNLKDVNGGANTLNLIGYLNRSQFDHSAGHVLPTISGFESAVPGGVSHYLDPANGRVHVALRRGWRVKDEIDQLKWDGVWKAAASPSGFTASGLGTTGLNQIHFGMMRTTQRKFNERRDNEGDAVHCTFCGYPDSPDIPNNFMTVFNAGNGFLSGVSGSGGIPHQWLRFDAEQLFAFQEANSGISFDAKSRGNSYAVEEQVVAAYANAEFYFDLEPMYLTANLGIRYEQTQVTVTGSDTTLTGLYILDQTELGQQTSLPTPVTISNQYDQWLPNLDLRLEVSDAVVARLSLSQTMTRPTLTQMAPAVSIDTTRQGGDLRASVGNPQLQPFASTNFDLAGEWYYDDASYLAMGYFRKDVDNFIVSQVEPMALGNGVTDPSTGSDPNAPDAEDSLAIFDVTTPSNGEVAAVDGLEFSLQHTFGDSGFGVLANMTFVDSNAQLDPQDVTQKFALTGLSDSQNLVAFYEKGPWQLRLAWNHRDGFLQSLVQIQGAEPTFVEDYQQIDVSGSYDFNDNVTLFFEGVNLTAEETIKHGRYANQLLLVQDTGARYALGLRGNF